MTVIDSGPGTPPREFWLGGRRGYLASVSLNFTDIARLMPASPMMAPLALSYLADGSCAAVGAGVVTATCPTQAVLPVQLGSPFQLSATKWRHYQLQQCSMHPPTLLHYLAASLRMTLPTDVVLLYPQSQSHSVYLTYDSGASWKYLCTPYSNAYGTGPTSQLKVVHTRTSASAAGKSQLLIVHPYAAYLWPSSGANAGCGDLIYSSTPVFDISQYRVECSNKLIFLGSCGMLTRPESRMRCYVRDNAGRQSKLPLRRCVRGVGLYKMCGSTFTAVDGVRERPRRR
jgi:hypothetical protein